MYCGSPKVLAGRTSFGRGAHTIAGPRRQHHRGQPQLPLRLGARWQPASQTSFHRFLAHPLCLFPFASSVRIARVRFTLENSPVTQRKPNHGRLIAQCLAHQAAHDGTANLPEGQERGAIRPGAYR